MAEVSLGPPIGERWDKGSYDRRKERITPSEGVIDIRDVNIVIELSHPLTCLSPHLSHEISICLGGFSLTRALGLAPSERPLSLDTDVDE